MAMMTIIWVYSCNRDDKVLTQATRMSLNPTIETNPQNDIQAIGSKGWCIRHWDKQYVKKVKHQQPYFATEKGLREMAVEEHPATCF